MKKPDYNPIEAGARFLGRTFLVEGSKLAGIALGVKLIGAVNETLVKNQFYGGISVPGIENPNLGEQLIYNIFSYPDMEQTLYGLGSIGAGLILGKYLTKATDSFDPRMQECVRKSRASLAGRKAGREARKNSFESQQKIEEAETAIEEESTLE